VYRTEDGWKTFMGCAFMALMGVAVAIFIAIVFVITRDRAVAGAGAAGLAVIAAVLLRRSMRSKADAAPRSDPTAVPVPLADLQPGRAAHTAGLVAASVHPGPLGAPDCVFHRVVVTDGDPDRVVYDARSADEIVLDDGGGAELVVPLAGAQWLGPPRAREIASSPEAPDDPVASYLLSRGVRVDGAVRARIEWIAAHELVFVRGLVREVAKSPGGGYRAVERRRLELAPATEHPVCLALEPIGESRLKELGR
jgi:hypothetical protein